MNTTRVFSYGNDSDIVYDTVANPIFNSIVRDLPATLENAFSNLLEQRNEPVLSGQLNPDSLNEDDIICNTNLHTASLFKTLSEKYKEVTKQMDDYNDSIQAVYDSVIKIEKSVNILKDACVGHYPEGSHTIESKYPTVKNDFVDIQNNLISSITKKRNALEIESDNISRKLNALRKLILTGIKEVVKPEDVQKKMCPVCFEKEVDMVLIPCGHTYCKGCCSDIDRNRYAKCPQCRAQVNSRIKIFFSV